MNTPKTPAKRSRRDVSPEVKIIGEKKAEVEPREAWEHVPEALKAHCEKFTPVTHDDPLAVPQPRHLLAQGLNCYVLCRKCAAMGRGLLVTSLPEKVSGLVVPMCPSCAKANARISQAVFYAGTVKSLVDIEKENEALHS